MPNPGNSRIGEVKNEAGKPRHHLPATTPSRIAMNTLELNRRQALIVGGMGALSLGMPGMVMGSDKLDASGKAVAAEKSCIFVLLCGGPSHIDTWDMKPDAPDTIRGPYQPIATKVPGMRINEMHTELAKLTDQFTLINSMTHPGAISNHFDAMHNLLSGQSTKRVQEGVTDDQPYLGSFVAKHRPSKRNIVSNAWLIKCVGPPVFCAPNIGIGGYLGSAYAPVFVGSEKNHPAMDNFKPPEIYDLGDQDRLDQRRELLGKHREQRAGQGRSRRGLGGPAREGLRRHDASRGPGCVQAGPRAGEGARPLRPPSAGAEPAAGPPHGRGRRAVRHRQRLDRPGAARYGGPAQQQLGHARRQHGHGRRLRRRLLRHGILPAAAGPGAVRAAHRPERARHDEEHAAWW